ncbi:MAG: LysR family transcriptional regulator [Acuticoccus sp.]
METRHIGFLKCVAMHGSISSAAHVLGMTQPALTKIILRIENSIGVRLFDRKSRGVELTPIGAIFVNRMDVVESAMRDLEHEIRSLKEGSSGTVSIGIGQFWAGSIVPSVVARLTNELPDVQVRIFTGARDELVRQLESGEIDLMLARHTDDLSEEMAFEPLAEVRLFLTVRADHALARLGRLVTLRDLEPYGWILESGSGPTAVHLEQLFRKLNARHKPTAVEVSSQTMTTAILQKTELVTAMPEITASKFPDGLCRLETDWLDWSSQTGVVRMADRSLLPCVSRFLELLRDEV